MRNHLNRFMISFPTESRKLNGWIGSSYAIMKINMQIYDVDEIKSKAVYFSSLTVHTHTHMPLKHSLDVSWKWWRGISNQQMSRRQVKDSFVTKAEHYL